MGSLKAKGIILQENNMGDFDKMVTLLTPAGKIGCAAKGARRNNSALWLAHNICVLEIICYIKVLIHTE